jgi:L-fuconolactonase
MYGSDWPVCLIATSYSKVKQIVEQYFSSFSKPEKEDFFGKNAIKFYKL